MMKQATTTQNSALDHKWFSNHIDEEWISLLMIGLHQAYNWTSHCYCGAKLGSHDYPLLQDSKGIIVMCMIIFIPN